MLKTNHNESPFYFVNKVLKVLSVSKFRRVHGLSSFNLTTLCVASGRQYEYVLKQLS